MSAAKTIEKTVAGLDVKIVQFHAVRGFRLKARVLKVVMPVLAPILGSLDLKKVSMKNIMDLDIDLNAMLPKVFSAVAEQIDDEVLLKLFLDLLSQTFVNGKEIDEQSFDTLFIADYFKLYKLVYEVVMFNNFFGFGDITSKLPGLAATMESLAEK